MTGAVNMAGAMPASVPVLENLGAVPILGASSTTDAGPDVIAEPGGSAGGVAFHGLASADDLGLEIERLQANSSQVKTDNEKVVARMSKKAQLESIEKRLLEIQRAAEERAASEKKGFWSKLFKWVAAIAAAIAGVVAAAFSSGTTAVAGIALAAVILAEEVVKVVTDVLVECGALSDKAAMGIRAAFGSIEDIINSLAAVGAFGEHGDTVAKVLNLVVGAAQAIVSCVVGGWDNAAQIVGNVLSLTSTTVKAAQEAIMLVAEEMDAQGKLSPEAMLALEIVALCLDVAAAGCALGGGDEGGSGTTATPTRGAAGARAVQLTELSCEATESAALAAKAGFDVSIDLDRADAAEAEASAEAERLLIDAAAARIASAREALQSVFEDLEAVRDEVDSMLEAASFDPFQGGSPARA
jgi:hypothetical protein